MLIEKVNNGIYSQCRIPGIVMTENGTLLAYYECRKTELMKIFILYVILYFEKINFGVNLCQK